MTTNKATLKQLLGIIVLLAFLLMGCSSGGGDESTASSVSDDTAADTSSDATDDGSDTSDGGSTSDISNITMDSVGSPGDLGGLVDIGDLIGSGGDNWYWTKVAAINDDGLVVGQSSSPNPVKEAFLWDEVNFYPEGLGIEDDAPGTYDGEADGNPFIYSEAVGIGPDGDVIGNSTTGTGWPDEEEKRAFYWNSDDGFVDLHEEFVTIKDPDAGDFSEAYFINENFVLLTIEDEDGNKNAWRYDKSDGSFDGLGKIIGATLTEPVAINDLNQAVVNSEGSTAVFHDLNLDVIQTLNHLPGATATTAVAINDNIDGDRQTGHIAGTSGDHAFFWHGGVMTSCGDLGGCTSEAIDMNNNDIVVGNSTTSDGSTHAFSWKPVGDKGEMTDLGTLGGANSYATAINDNGWIVGYSETGETYTCSNSICDSSINQPIVHACAWYGGVIYDLGTHDDFYPYILAEPMPFSIAVDINEDNRITGNSYSINSHYRGFVIDAVAP